MSIHVPTTRRLVKMTEILSWRDDMGRKIVATEYVTLDGFMDEPGQWSMPFFSEDAGAFKYQELFASDALLLGRRTYEGFAKAWPTMTDLGDFAEKMNGVPKYVASRTLSALTWQGFQRADSGRAGA
jgi:dihydrofolate reductase